MEEIKKKNNFSDFSFNYKPKTELGKKLIKIRRKLILEEKIKLFSIEEVEQELKLRRAGE